jgi:hypothetical protein
MEDEVDFGAQPEYEAEGFETLSNNDGGMPATMPQMPRRTSSDMPMTSGLVPSEATNKWKADNEKRIKQKDAEYVQAKKELAKKAEEALEKARTERAQKIAKNAKANRDAQAKVQAASASKAAAGGAISWQKISQLIDLEKETPDKERMRQLFKSKVDSKA